MQTAYQTKSYYLYKLLDASLFLLPEKAVYWKEEKTLILTDLHLGKAAHFRKSGIQVPESVHIPDYVRFKNLIRTYAPEKVLILGDLFHSSLNREWERFSSLIQDFPVTKFLLIRGNHDILQENLYSLANLEIAGEVATYGPFQFVHQFSGRTSNRYILSGHIHPAVRINGPAKQSLMLPCFYFTKTHGILPAFGNFTGMAKINPKKNDDIFVILENSLVKI